MDKSLELTVETNPGHEGDIFKYVTDRLKLRDFAVVDEILKKADGVFLWVCLTTNALDKAYDEGRVEAMGNVLQGLPPDINGLYHTIIHDITSNRDRRYSEENQAIQ